jgi:hypothetical protein
MTERRPPRPLMLLLAAAFIAEAWIWDSCTLLARAIAERIPWAPFKRRVKAAIAFLPAPVVVVLFVVPLVIVELIKPVTLWIAATGHPVTGLTAYVIAQFGGVGVVAAMFDLTRDKLMEMRSFVWCYDKVMAFHDFAHHLLAPYKEAVLRELRAWRQRKRDFRARAMMDGAVLDRSRSENGS